MVNAPIPGGPSLPFSLVVHFSVEEQTSTSIVTWRIERISKIDYPNPPQTDTVEPYSIHICQGCRNCAGRKSEKYRLRFLDEQYAQDWLAALVFAALAKALTGYPLAGCRHGLEAYPRAIKALINSISGHLPTFLPDALKRELSIYSPEKRWSYDIHVYIQSRWKMALYWAVPEAALWSIKGREVFQILSSSPNSLIMAPLITLQLTPISLAIIKARVVLPIPAGPVSNTWPNALFFFCGSQWTLAIVPWCVLAQYNYPDLCCRLIA